MSSSVQVQLWCGAYSCPRAVADVFSGDTLTITSLDDDSTLREFAPGEWIDVLVTDDHGHPLYAHTATTPPRQLDLTRLDRSREASCVGDPE